MLASWALSYSRGTAGGALWAVGSVTNRTPVNVVSAIIRSSGASYKKNSRTTLAHAGKRLMAFRSRMNRARPRARQAGTDAHVQHRFQQFRDEPQHLHAPEPARPGPAGD